MVGFYVCLGYGVCMDHMLPFESLGLGVRVLLFDGVFFFSPSTNMIFILISTFILFIGCGSSLS